ncbi:MAG: ABC transporter permease [Pseudohongiellaceae bacterium]
MFKSYLKLTLNHMLSHKLYTVINVLGLSVGLACFLLISLYIADELSYDNHWQNADRLYRVSRDYYPTEFRVSGRRPASINAPFAPQLKAEFPQVEESARLFPFAQPQIRLNDVSFQESRFMYVDAAFVDLFSFEWVRGNAGRALAEPFSLVLTESMAVKYFGDDNPMGQTLSFTYSADVPMQITGVIRDLPENTHLEIDALASLTTLSSLMGDGMLTNWNSLTDFHTYIRLAPNTVIENLEREFPAFIERHIGEGASVGTGVSAQRVPDIHLRSQRTEELVPPGNIVNVYSFIAIAVAILTIACINFMNLSTARSSSRAREVGMRKAVGARNSQLVAQFLGESLLMTVIALLVAITLVELLLPWFNAFVGRTLDFPWYEWRVLSALVLLAVLVGAAAGSYPAFFLSSFNPSRVLKAGVNLGSAGALFRKALVVTQFAIAIVLIVATGVIYAQMNFARNIDLGLEKDRVAILSGNSSVGLGEQWLAMKQELLAFPEITEVTRSHYVPFTHDDNAIPVLRNRNEVQDAQPLKFMAVDYDFFATYGIEIIAGRDFDEGRADRLVLPGENQPASSGGFILNESAVREMGWTVAESLGQTVWISLQNTPIGPLLDGPAGFELIGVAEDGYFESLTTPLEPMMFFIPSTSVTMTPPLRHAALKLTGESMEQTFTHIDNVWREFRPETPIDRRFLNDHFNALYQGEQQQSVMLTCFTVLAIFIACLGLYGLASFNAERRTREIGVRKVLGGSVWSIVVLLTNDFSKLVLLANIIAWPVAWLVMNRWLENFAYRVDLTPVAFIGGGLLALLIAWVTVGGQAAKAAKTNPVLALRYE